MILAQQHRFTLPEHLRRRLRLVAAISAEEMRNRLEFLSNWPVRPTGRGWNLVAGVLAEVGAIRRAHAAC